MRICIRAAASKHTRTAVRPPARQAGGHLKGAASFRMGAVIKCRPSIVDIVFNVTAKLKLRAPCKAPVDIEMPWGALQGAPK